MDAYERLSTLDLAFGVKVPSSKPPRWLASNPIGSNLSTGCRSRIESAGNQWAVSRLGVYLPPSMSAPPEMQKGDAELARPG
jgi:hypothetical protein